ncbi:MAG TPA: TetR/AcrR family transcriptional regulator [Acidimicrobiales bacterium]|nr:TetR/AcrR family transcriptional regulator [Acidimicrobiales bacterium]
MTARLAGPGAAGDSRQRTRILDTALTLVSQQGAAGTSMRRLASACGLNVATIYHYFPSKADLLRALIEERRYGERMATEDPPLAADLAPGERLARFFEWLAGQTLEEQTVLRLLVGEGLHGNETARQSARDLVAALDATVAGWLAAGLPELGEATPPPVAARLVRRALLSLVTEHLATGTADAASYADDLAAALFGAPG